MNEPLMPMPSPQEHEAALFAFVLALDIPAAERAAVLDRECAGDAALRARLKARLAAHEESHTLPAAQTEAARPTIKLDLPDRADETLGTRISHYKLLQKLGEGGCGVVYMADQEEPVRRSVALKVIKLGMDTREVVARFEAERQALALMDHPNIARVLDAGVTESGRPYFVMELVQGMPITHYCDLHNLSTLQRLELFTQVCHAIQHAHQKGVIHRDIKPSNILVTLQDGAPVPKVIDFGIAKAIGQQRLTEKTMFTALGQFLGTPAYMSPEQAEMSGLDIDTRTDIYALGVLLYELLTGKTPFETEELLQAGLDEMRRIIREKEPVRPSTRISALDVDEQTKVARCHHAEIPKLVHRVRGDLDWIAMKCLEKDRTRRYDTANGLAMDLKRHINNEAVVARPPSTAYVFSKWVRRHKVAFAASAAVAASLVIGLSASTWLFVKEKAARTRAVGAEQEQIKLRTQADTARANEQKLRVQAEADEKKAKTAAAKSEQVAEFMKDMLTGVGPSVALGRDTTMLREILDKTAERLGKDLKDQPEVEAELRSTLGGVYLELGDYPKSEALLNEALELRRKLHGNEHPSVAESLNVVALVMLSQGKFFEAETLARESLAICRKLHGNKDAATVNALHILTIVLTRQMKLTEADALHREALALSRKVHGGDHHGVAGALTELFNQDMEGKLAASESLFREALARQRKQVGNEHPQLILPLMSLGFVVEQQGKLAEAEGLYRECLAMQRKFLGNEHPQLASTLILLAGLAKKQGNIAEGKILQDEADSIQKKASGSAEISVAQTQFEKGVALLKQGKWAEAETQLREALAVFKKLRGAEHQSVADTLSELAEALDKQRKPAEREKVLRELLGLREKR